MFFVLESYSGSYETPSISWKDKTLRGHLGSTRRYAPEDLSKTAVQVLWDAGEVLKSKEFDLFHLRFTCLLSLILSRVKFLSVQSTFVMQSSNPIANGSKTQAQKFGSLVFITSGSGPCLIQRGRLVQGGFPAYLFANTLHYSSQEYLIQTILQDTAE